MLITKSLVTMSEYPICIKYIVEFQNLSNSYNRIFLKIKENSTFSIVDKACFEEALFIKHFTEWEILIYNLFTYCVALDTDALGDYVGLQLPKSISIDNAYAILNGLHFTSFSSTDDLQNWATKLITQKNNPFDQFLPPMLKYVDQAYIIRNYIVHKSQVSKRKLLKMYLDQYDKIEFEEPGIFLQKEQKYDFGRAHTSMHYLFVFNMMALLSWQFLHKESYEKVFNNEKAKKDSVMGYFQMAMLFEQLTNQFNWEK